MKLIQHLTITAVVCFALGSCKGVFFKHPQPAWVAANDSAFPPELCGYYVTADSTAKNGYGGVYINPQKIADSDSDIYTLSDSVILKHYGTKYFLNIPFREDENKSTKVWALVKFEEKGGKLDIGLFYPDSLITLLKSYTAVTTPADDTVPYFIDPTAAELKKIIAQPLFWNNLHYSRVSEKEYEKLFPHEH